MSIYAPPISENTTLVIEGKKVFSRFIEHKTQDIKQPLYRYTGTGKGRHSEIRAKKDITAQKIDLLLEYARKAGAYNIRRSNTTKSVYFDLNSIEFRISDHKNPAFEGITFIIQWNSTGKNCKDLIDLFNK